jgi:hypothetical protein
MAVGFDLDGVLFMAPEGVERKDYRPLRMGEYYRLLHPTGLFPEQIASGDEWYLITARRNRYRKPTLETLKKYGIVPEDWDDEKYLIMMPAGGSKNKQRCIDHKVEAINAHDIKTFYEDDGDIVQGIMEYTDCEVHMVVIA